MPVYADWKRRRNAIIICCIFLNFFRSFYWCTSIRTFYIHSTICLSLIYLSEANIRFHDYLSLKWELYVAYLVPVMMIAYGTLVLNFLIVKVRQTGKDEPAVISGKMVIVKDEIGELPGQVEDILWIKRDGRKNIIKTYRYHYLHRRLSIPWKKNCSIQFRAYYRGTLVPLTNMKKLFFLETERYIFAQKTAKSLLCQDKC